MKNKHVFLNNNGHNKSVFENFCDATSEFDAEDLLQILVNRYWDESDLIRVTDLLDDILKEAREPNKYKLRAECLHDVLELFKLVRVEDYSIVNIGLTDVVVSFSSKEDWFKIDEKFLEIPDSHVMRETFTYERDYTGDRDVRYTIEEVDDTGVDSKIPNQTYSAVMSCIHNANIDFGEIYTDIESFNEGEDHRRIYKEIEYNLSNGDLRFDIDKIKELNPSIIITKEYDSNIDDKFLIDVGCTSYWYANEEDRDADFEILKIIVPDFGFVEQNIY